MNNRIVRVLMDADLRCAHSGLKALASARGIDLNRLKPHEHIVFLNRAKTKVKLFKNSNISQTYVSHTSAN